MNRLAHFLLSQSWPQGDLDLLLRVALLPAADAAKCWDRWKAHHDLDDVTWEEHKLLAPIASRLPAIAPDCPYRPRVQGLAKAHWTTSQLVLRDSAAALDTLLEHAIPVMLLKGGALQAAGVSGSGPRISGDLDILVPRPLYPRAITLLYAEGWSSRDSREYAQSSWRFRSGLNLRRGLHGDIDVHHQPVPAPRLTDAALDALWARATPARFHGRPVVVPSHADMIALTAAHAARPATSRQISAAWAFDLIALLKQDGLEPEKVVDSAAALDAMAASIACLLYLDSLVPLDNTKRVIRELESHGIGARQMLGLVAAAQNSPSSAPLRRLAALIAERPKSHFERERQVVPRIRRLRLPLSGKTVTPLLASAGEPRLRHEFELGGAKLRGPGNLIIEIEFDRPSVARRFRFDIAVDAVPIARLGARLSKRAQKTRLTFSVPLPRVAGSPARVAIEALAEGEIPAKANLEQVLRAKPVPFRIARVALR
ncbi:nucleotidyltransferase family protein [Parvibaculum sp.]|uniref:nucleotidyltransferase family protein n=1 Tax=Parvibaculum sp. TaxID=2024848 RepID=UPI0032112F85